MSEPAAIPDQEVSGQVPGQVPGQVTVIRHPLVQHKLTLMRQKQTSTGEFRRLAREISLLMAYELTRDLPIETTGIETPLEPMQAPILAGKKLCIVSILRAGDGILEGMLDLVPSARVGHIGLYRDPHTLVPVEYYLKLPEDVSERLVIVVDPMLATGHSAAAALARLKEAGAEQLRFACLLAAPEGIGVLAEAHPEVPVFTCSVDRELDAHAYIRPGLGDAGDRLYGTK
ncbi:uracil phosphoribosyltransferase [Roseomonas sp. KE0001]|uniref:uracil phosphoribosyltransferase n=1 Tax=Roseomonas sp. KE0001 TaxID=2479201 RepID=UPI0018DF1CD3|nr:uracil phosphoribosyltransferase [Roseomonas sp. KE0001]MBI0435498.1 uracil phosphoribosyltransferase [Roseomonas sp. KE0001]